MGRELSLASTDIALLDIQTTKQPFTQRVSESCPSYFCHVLPVKQSAIRHTHIPSTIGTSLSLFGMPISGLAIDPTTTRRISDDARFIATDAFYPDRMLAIRGVLAGIYS
jgi:hypothetical protein